MDFLTLPLPTDTPLEFKLGLVPEDKLIHRGIFSPDLEEYYYTLSDKDFARFDAYMHKKRHGKWSLPEEAFFNGSFSEHGMSFSPDGNTLYFSSTRPTNKKGVSETWHIWKSENVNGQWTEPIFIDFSNLRDKLVSHPTVTNAGTLYFHVSELDYSQMDIYCSTQVNGQFQKAEKANIAINHPIAKCTPYVSPKEDYLIFATVGNQLDLMISFNDGHGNWTNTRKLNAYINQFGQGNPYVTPDNKFLFYTSGNELGENWKVNWVNIESELLPKQ